MSNKDACNCDQTKALQSEIELAAHDHAAEVAARTSERDQARADRTELRAAAFQVLAWIDRSTSVGREAAERLERALAVGAREAEPEVVETPPDWTDNLNFGHREK